MPLKNLIDDQINSLRAFLEFPSKTLCCVRYDPDVKHILMKVLNGLEDEEDNPHLLTFADTSFVNPQQFFTDLLKELVESNEQCRAEVAAAGVDLPYPGPERIPAPLRFESYVSAVADSFPETVGAYVIILDPQRIDDPAGFGQTMLFLADSTRSQWVKFLVLDNCTKPLLPRVAEQSERAAVIDFHLGPERIEAQVKLDLQGGRLTPPERRQYLAMAGAFAFARGQLPQALQLQTEALQLAEREGTPTEQANALYSLGNTYLKSNQLAEAEGAFVRSAETCLAQKLNPLLAMVLTNLGVTLHRARRMDEALASLGVARRTFAALNNRPGEAYALDTRAAVLAAEKRNEEAEESWLEALAIYDGITNDAFAELRAAGREDICAKLSRFYQATRQKAKVKALQQKEMVAT